jgi:hypothetical protein
VSRIAEVIFFKLFFRCSFARIFYDFIFESIPRIFYDLVSTSLGLSSLLVFPLPDELTQTARFLLGECLLKMDNVYDYITIPKLSRVANAQAMK